MPRQEQPKWENYKKMIQNRARHYNQKNSSIEIEELISEGNLIFVQACQKFDASRAKFSTFLWRCLTNGLLAFCIRQRKICGDLTYDGALPHIRHDGHLQVKTAVFIQQSIARLPDYGRRAVQLLIEQPEALGLDGSEPPKAVRGALLNHLRAEQQNWSVAQHAIREIKNIFMEV